MFGLASACDGQNESGSDHGHDPEPGDADAAQFHPYAGPDKILVANAAKKSVTVHLVAAEGKVANG